MAGAPANPSVVAATLPAIPALDAKAWTPEQWLQVEAMMNALQAAYAQLAKPLNNQGLRGATGVIDPFGGTTPPPGALLCDGSAVSRTVYAALFAAIGTAWGVGDGSTTFNLPNGKAMFLRGAGSQMVGGVAYAGPALGAVQADAMQGHQHRSVISDFLGDSPGGPAAQLPAGAGADSRTTTGTPVTDGVNGTPRISSETRPVNLGVNFIIWT